MNLSTLLTTENDGLMAIAASSVLVALTAWSLRFSEMMATSISVYAIIRSGTFIARERREVGLYDEYLHCLESTSSISIGCIEAKDHSGTFCSFAWVFSPTPTTRRFARDEAIGIWLRFLGFSLQILQK